MRSPRRAPHSSERLQRYDFSFVHASFSTIIFYFRQNNRTFAGKMEKNYYFKVAGHVFVVNNATADDITPWLDHYSPFRIEKTDEAPVFTLRVTERIKLEDFQQEIHQDDDGSEIMAGTEKSGLPCFKFLLQGRHVATLLTDHEYREASVAMRAPKQFGLDNALMVMYALATATRQTALFHSSVVSYQGRGYMFLGKSGTGKSTHSSLWLKHIEGTELVNDDNPVVRVLPSGEIRVYGSPWSGKTPCYRNIDYPVGAIVLLSQAPYNRIEQLIKLQAYAAIVPSISGKRWDKHIAEGLHLTENLLAQHAPIYHLDCLPDEDAARLCCKTVTNAQ